MTQTYITMTVIKTKRAYDTPDESDGYRILVDRLWPRGLTHERLDCQLWEKALAPSTQLREWFHADSPARWAMRCARKQWKSLVITATVVPDRPVFSSSSLE